METWTRINNDVNGNPARVQRRADAMRLVIEEYWNRLEPIPPEQRRGSFINRVIRDEYVKKGECSYPNGGGWKDVQEWRKAVKQQHHFLGFTDDGKAKIDRGSYYGIHAYQLVSLQVQP